jgi:hypothetical protein
LQQGKMRIYIDVPMNIDVSMYRYMILTWVLHNLTALAEAVLWIYYKAGFFFNHENVNVMVITKLMYILAIGISTSYSFSSR